jgi:polar amino acid transport system substrate-binding protein
MGRSENKGKVYVQTGERPGEINAANLALGRLDGIIEDPYVMQHIIAKQKLKDKVVLAGCGEPTPLYVAFSPKLKNARKLARLFDDGLVELRRNGQLAKILAKYGLNDWK